MLTVLDAVAEMERDMTIEQQIREGMAKAKLYGTGSGRPAIAGIPATFKEYYPMWKDGDITATDFARLIGDSRPTLYKYIQEHEICCIPHASAL